MVSPKNSFLDWDTTAGSNTDVGGIGILGTNAVNNFDNALRTIMAQLRSGVDGEVVYASKSGNYTALAADNNAVHRYTAAATVALTAAATLGANWHYTVTADGGAVTIDPNASETINGLATLIVPDGSTAEIVCDGSNFFTVIRPTGWVAIGAPITFSGQSSVAWTDLSSFRSLRMRLEFTPSANMLALLRVSTNNGSSYLSGASDYIYSALVQQQTIVNGLAAANTSSFLLNDQQVDAAGLSVMTVDISNFNKNLSSMYKSDASHFSSSLLRRGLLYGNTFGTTARNALQLSANTGNFTSGQVILEGIRG